MCCSCLIVFFYLTVLKKKRERREEDRIRGERGCVKTGERLGLFRELLDVLLEIIRKAGFNNLKKKTEIQNSVILVNILNDKLLFIIK